MHPFHKLEAQLPSALLEELFGITLLIGRLKDLPASVQSAFTMSNQGKVCIMCDGGFKKTPTIMNTRVVIKKRKVAINSEISSARTFHYPLSLNVTGGSL